MDIDDGDPFFTSLCSSKTLQSTSQGFFMDFADHVAEVAGDNWLRGVFGKQTSDQGRIQTCYSNKKVGPVVRDTLKNVREIFRPKSEQVSKQLCKNGDVAWISGNPKQALLFYTQSVIRAPFGAHLAEALAARSEALLALGHFQLSVTDIQLSIKHGYPAEQRYRLYQRMGECYRQMGLFQKAKLSFQLTIKLLSEDPNRQNKDGIADLQAEIENLNTSKPSVNLPEETKKTIPPLTGGSNSILCNASSKLQVSESSGATGRFVVARENISTADTLVTEPAYAACLLPECFGSHCHHCFQRLISPMGCTECSSIAFCSTVCRDQALGSYHKYECHYMDLLIGSGMSVLCHLALRIITQSGLQHFLTLRHKLDARREEIRDQYFDVYDLVTHGDKRQDTDFLNRTLMSLFLLRCLQRSNFFNEPTPDDQGTLSEDEIFIGSLLLRHLQLLQFNAHEVSEMCLMEDKQIKSSRHINIGVAIYPTVALFNHDCYPGVSRHFVGTTIVIKATRPLTVGQEISENYGPIFTKRNLASRQRALTSRYWFKCGCRACVEDWPLLDKLNNSLFRFKCPTPGCIQHFPRAPEMNSRQKVGKAKCPKCKKNISLEDSVLEFCNNEINYSQGQDAMEARNMSQAIELYSKYLDRLHSLGSPPFKDVHVCEIALRCCFMLEGNVWVSPIKQ